MIRHCVMFRWKDGTSAATIGAVEAALAAALGKTGH